MGDGQVAEAQSEGACPGTAFDELSQLQLNDVKAGAFTVEPMIAEDYDRVGALIADYADQRIGFVDASVLAVLTDREREVLKLMAQGKAKH